MISFVALLLPGTDLPPLKSDYTTRRSGVSWTPESDAYSVFCLFLSSAPLSGGSIKRFLQKVVQTKEKTKEILSKQAVKIAQQAEEHEKFINKVTHFIGATGFGGFCFMLGARPQDTPYVYCLFYFIFVPLQWIYYWYKKWHYYLLIRHGEAVRIIGPSGTGKSTVLKIMAGLLRLLTRKEEEQR